MPFSQTARPGQELTLFVGNTLGELTPVGVVNAGQARAYLAFASADECRYMAAQLLDAADEMDELAERLFRSNLKGGTSDQSDRAG